MARRRINRQPAFQPRVINDPCSCEYVTTPTGRELNVSCEAHAHPCATNGCVAMLRYGISTQCADHLDPFVFPLNTLEE